MPAWWRNRSQRRAAALADALTDESVRLAAAGRWPQAEAVQRQIIQLRTDHLGPHAPATLAARGERAAVLGALGRHEEAGREARAVLPLAVAARGEDHDEVRGLRAVLGRALVESRRYDEAEPELRAVLPLAVAARGEDHDEVHELRFLLGRVLIATGRPDQAEELARAVLTAHPAVDLVRVRAWRARALALNSLGRHREAAAEYTTLLTAAPAVLGERHRLLLASRSHRLQQLAVLGEHDQVEREYQALLSDLPDDDRLRRSVTSAQVFALNSAGRHTEAEALARTALARHPGTGLSAGLARSLTALGRPAEALQVLTDAEADNPRIGGGALAVLFGFLTAQALLGLDRPEEAEARARRAVDLARAHYHPDNHRALEAATTLGRALAALGRV
ncbi:tetratricopeptide repeat protein [Kitasatospora sp. NPDC028055]|uniref:tetratricopeptide repeat protein n=1 Tax=Kitasatospora sp. NPDC028055 TaxID=3155653 RepID=UPI0033DD75A2